MRRPVPIRLALVGGAVGLLVLSVIGLVRACTGPKALTFAQYQTLMQSGTIAGVSNTLTSAPQRPSFNVEQLRASYLNVPTCATYWTSAAEHLLGTSSALSANATPDPEGVEGVEGVETQLWDDQGSAAAAMDTWATCLRDFQELSKSSSYPVKVVSHGVTGEVVWQYSENIDLNSPVHLLALRARNLIVTLQVPDSPAPDLRDQFVRRFAAEVEAAAGP